jgi:hypothetical protein
MLFINLTRHGSGRKVAVNPAAIAYLDVSEGGGIVVFGSAEQLRVTETPDQVIAAIGKAARKAGARQDVNPGPDEKDPK